MNRVHQRWLNRSIAINRNSVFLIGEERVEPSLAKIREKAPREVMGMINKYYGGDVVAFFEDDGRKAREDNSFAFTNQMRSEYKELKKYKNATIWAQNQMRKLGAPEPSGGFQNSAGTSGTIPTVNTEEELQAMIESGTVGPGDMVRGPDGSTIRLK